MMLESIYISLCPTYDQYQLKAMTMSGMFNSVLMILS